MGRLPAGHRDHHFRREADRAGPADDRLSQEFEKSAMFPRFRSRGSGPYREVDEKGVIRFYAYVVREGL